jgi:HPt (histidine-containing phosphotransfer) domain-containing protein
MSTTTDTSQSIPVVDPEVVDELMMLKAATGRDLLAEFLARVESGAALPLGPLRSACASADAAAIAAAAHTLKGTTGSYGLARASALAGELTEAARSGRIDPASLSHFELALSEGLVALARLHRERR